MKETVDIDILKRRRKGDRKIMEPIRIMSGPPTRKRNWNQLSQFKWTSTKVIPGYISTITQGFKRGSKCCISSPIHPFL